MTAINLNSQELARQLTLHVSLHGAQMLRFRTRLGTRLIRLGAWVIGCGIVIEQDGESM